jgi:hypothetical protein
MIKSSDLLTSIRQAYAGKWGYIWGTRGQVWTQTQQDKATRDMTRKYGQKWVGKRVADCSGLIKWAYREHGGDIYHGSNTMWQKYTGNKGTLSGTLELKPGTAVFTVSDGVRGHVGIYIGGGKCIEAKGTAYGVVMSDLQRWDEWGELTGIEYDLPAEVVTIGRRTLRKGDEGGDVELLQTLLNADSRYPTKVDGIYGSDTTASVRAFQSDHGLTPDGICGPLTWAALDASGTDDDEAEEKPTEDAPVEDSLTIEERIERLEKAVFGQEGGESDG